MILLYKPLGISPLDALEELRLQKPALKDAKMSYAGRLDPMAEGLIIVLVDEENKKRDDFLKMDKSYEVEIVFGLETDSYDVLGLPQMGKNSGGGRSDVGSDRRSDRRNNIDRKQLEDVLKTFTGSIEQAYPPFSSKTVDGKPLYWWVRQGRLKDIKIPTAKRNVFNISCLDISETNATELQKAIEEKLALVKGDFRQEEIKIAWKKLLQASENKSDSAYNSAYIVARLSIYCSSGTYVRTLVHDVGKKLGTGAIVLSLVRTVVGPFKLEDATRLEKD